MDLEVFTLVRCSILKIMVVFWGLRSGEVLVLCSVGLPSKTGGGLWNAQGQPLCHEALLSKTQCKNRNGKIARWHNAQFLFCLYYSVAVFLFCGLFFQTFLKKRLQVSKKGRKKEKQNSGNYSYKNKAAVLESSSLAPPGRRTLSIIEPQAFSWEETVDKGLGGKMEQSKQRTLPIGICKIWM